MKLSEMSLEDVAISGQVGAQAEMMRRQTAAQIASARYMLWSVIAITVTSAINALFALLTWYWPH